MSDPSSTRTRSVSRRTIVKGAAWAAPAVAMVSAAPAFAASQTQNTSINGYVTIGGNCLSRGGVAIEIDSTGRGYGLFINNTTTSTTITNPFIIFYISVPNLTWSASSGNSGWSVPTFISGQTITKNGHVLYAYKSSLTTPVTAVNGTTTLPNMHFISSGGTCPTGGDRTVYALGERHVTINGEARSYDNGVTSVNLGYINNGVGPQAKSASTEKTSTQVTADEAGETSSF